MWGRRGRNIRDFFFLFFVFFIVPKWNTTYAYFLFPASKSRATNILYTVTLGY